MEKRLPKIRLSIKEQLEEATSLVILKRHANADRLHEWLKLRNDFPENIGTFDKIDDKIFSYRAKNPSLTFGQAYQHAWQDFFEYYGRGHSRKISKKLASKLQREFKQYNKWRESNSWITGQYIIPENKKFDRDTNKKVIVESYKMNGSQLTSKEMKLDVDTQVKMFCTKHAFFCYRGKIEGEYICPSEQHVGSIWASK